MAKTAVEVAKEINVAVSQETNVSGSFSAAEAPQATSADFDNKLAEGAAASTTAAPAKFGDLVKMNSAVINMGPEDLEKLASSLAKDNKPLAAVALSRAGSISSDPKLSLQFLERAAALDESNPEHQRGKKMYQQMVDLQSQSRN